MKKRTKIILGIVIVVVILLVLGNGGKKNMDSDANQGSSENITLAPQEGEGSGGESNGGSSDSGSAGSGSGEEPPELPDFGFGEEHDNSAGDLS